MFTGTLERTCQRHPALAILNGLMTGDSRRRSTFHCERCADVSKWQ
jgi:hypothetical protein